MNQWYQLVMHKNLFSQPEFKIGLGYNASMVDKLKHEIYVFLLHAYAIMYHRFWWSLRDSHSFLCQILAQVAFG